MLIQFSVGNYRSFKDTCTLSMVSTKANARDSEVNKNNTIYIDNKLTLLTSAAIYGANASGKSNLVDAIIDMCHLVLTSAKDMQAGEPLDIEPFRLSSETENKPSFFEIVFLLLGKQYRYGFEADNYRIISEWLFTVPSTKEAMLFIREDKIIKYSKTLFKEGKGLDLKTRDNALFLSVVAQFNGEIASAILGWFKNFGVVSGLDDIFYRDYTISQIMDGKYKHEIINLIQKLDLDLHEVRGKKVKREIPSDMPEDLKNLLIKATQGKDQLKVLTQHPKYDVDGNIIGYVTFDMDKDESQGTQKAFYLAGPIIDVLSRGQLLVIDEMEARLHPLITREIINLFNTLETNQKRAQLIFTTHDTNLLSNNFFRRDQIWFIEKDKYCSSHLYSLAELKIRNDASFEGDYLKGRYGAIPFLGGIKKIGMQ
jgi:AAA15 family ATPase/GTPase